MQQMLWRVFVLLHFSLMFGLVLKIDNLIFRFTIDQFRYVKELVGKDVFGTQDI